MSFSIEPINRETLSRMQEILTRSAGYRVTLQDELDYFDSQISLPGWLAATNSQNEFLGFIRSFLQGNWTLAEIYVRSNSMRHEIASHLLETFCNNTKFLPGHRLRFDALRVDQELNQILSEKGFCQKTQTFLMFQLDLEAISPKGFESPLLNTSTTRLPQTRHPHSDANPTEVAEVLSFLNPVSPSEASEWTENIRTVIHEDRVVAAAQIFNSDDAVEINRIATHADYLRQGHAKRLLTQIQSEAQTKGLKKIYLKVEDTRNPAISLYKKFGFREIPEQAQLWHSRWY